MNELIVRPSFNLMEEMKVMETARKFVRQLRKSFEGSEPYPIFSAIQENGKWKLTHIIRLETKIAPKIFYPIPKLEEMMSMSFQEKVLKILEKEPIKLSGKCTIKLKDVTIGRYVKISNVKWCIEVYKIKKLDLDANGVISISQFDFREKK